MQTLWLFVGKRGDIWRNTCERCSRHRARPTCQIQNLPKPQPLYLNSLLPFLWTLSLWSGAANQSYWYWSLNVKRRINRNERPLHLSATLQMMAGYSNVPTLQMIPIKNIESCDKIQPRLELLFWFRFPKRSQISCCQSQSFLLKSSFVSLFQTNFFLYF